MKKQPEKTAQTRAALITAFWELYKDRPITKITVKDVTERANLYRSTFYFYFTDIYCVLEQIEEDILRDWETKATEVFGQEKFGIMIDHITMFYEKYGEYISVLLSPNGDPMFLGKIKDTMRPKLFSVIHVSNDDTEALLIFEFLISGMLAFMTEWYKNAKHIPTRQAVDLLLTLYSEDTRAVMLRHATNGVCR